VGSYWALQIDDFELASSKGEAPDDILCLFQERDRRVRNSNRHGSEDETRYEYAAHTGVMRERLNVLGFTAERSERDFHNELAIEIERMEEGLCRKSGAGARKEQVFTARSCTEHVKLLSE
jgi:HEPN/Toprim N-terminal domain 1